MRSFHSRVRSRSNLQIRVQVRTEPKSGAKALEAELQELVDQLVAEAQTPDGAGSTIIYTYTARRAQTSGHDLTRTWT